MERPEGERRRDATLGGERERERGVEKEGSAMQVLERGGQVG